jgi:hypothetical protein
MLSFNILYSEDQSISPEFISYFDRFIIGSSKRADIIIDDELISPLHLKLEVKDSSLICKSYDNENSFKVNGKKYTGSKVIQINDEIVMGNTSIKITNFSKMEIVPNDNLEEVYSEAIEKIPALDNIISELEKEIILLERNNNVRE